MLTVCPIHSRGNITMLSHEKMANIKTGLEEKDDEKVSSKGKKSKGSRHREGKTVKPRASSLPTKSVKAEIKSDKKQKDPESLQKNHLVTDYFQVRRSSRVPAKSLKKQKANELEEAVLSQKEDGLKVTEIIGKGRGVVATQVFYKDDFVVEYAGDLIDSCTAKARERLYERTPQIGCYMYYFEYHNKTYCVDATAESGHMGRLINHSKLNANLYPKVVGVQGQPHLLLMASRNVKEGEELLYDYGDRSRASVEAHPWLAI